MMGHKPPTVSQRYQQNLSREAQDKAHREIIDNLYPAKRPRFKLEEAPEGYLKSLKNPKDDDSERNPNLNYLNLQIVLQIEEQELNSILCAVNTP